MLGPARQSQPLIHRQQHQRHVLGVVQYLALFAGFHHGCGVVQQACACDPAGGLPSCLASAPAAGGKGG